MKCSHDIDLRNASEMLLVSLVEYALENVNVFFLQEGWKNLQVKSDSLLL